MVITNPVDEERVETIDGKERNIGGMRVTTFVDEAKNEAIVVFRGTKGAYEWRDNAKGGYMADTPQQKAALDYVNGLGNFNSIIVTGHSKGGNKAMYVAIMSNKVDRCLSFDGQGFSKEFIREHSTKILKNVHKITSIVATKDYVNCLFKPIAGEIIYIKPKFRLNPAFYHCPNVILDKCGQFRKAGKQSMRAKMLNKYTAYVNQKVKDPMRGEILHKAMGMFESNKLSRIGTVIKITATLSTISRNHMVDSIELGKEPTKAESILLNTGNNKKTDKIKNNKNIEKKRSSLEEKIKQAKESKNEKLQNNIKNIVNKSKFQEKYEKGR